MRLYLGYRHNHRRVLTLTCRHRIQSEISELSHSILLVAPLVNCTCCSRSQLLQSCCSPSQMTHAALLVDCYMLLSYSTNTCTLTSCRSVHTMYQAPTLLEAPSTKMQLISLRIAFFSAFIRALRQQLL